MVVGIGNKVHLAIHPLFTFVLNNTDGKVSYWCCCLLWLWDSKEPFFNNKTDVWSGILIKELVKACNYRILHVTTSSTRT